MMFELSKIFEKWKRQNIKPKRSGGYVFASQDRERYFTLYVLLHKAALKGDWESAENLLKKYPTSIRAPITEGGETVLHIAAVEGHFLFVANLLEKMKGNYSDTEILNKKGNTALCFSAAAGHFNIAKLMVETNPNLPTIRGSGGVTPLYMAALLGHREVAEYLFPLSDFLTWTTEDQIILLTTTIESRLYGLAMNIWERKPLLAVIEDTNGETPLHVLARQPSAFFDSNRQGIIARTILPYMKLKTQKISKSRDVYRLFDCLWNTVKCQEDIETGKVIEDTTKLFFIAAESGNDEFLVEMISRNPNFLCKVNESKHSIFHIAIVHRWVKVFNLFYEFGGTKDLIARYVDKDGNNMLHLAARLSPQNQLNDIPGGAALQMQREVLWYKEVEKIVQTSYRNMRNSDGQTPSDLFLEKHEKLMKEGEKQMKQMAKSCMLVAMLISTVVFTAAFTVPGGYENNTGIPVLHDRKLFMIFPASEAVATLSSLTSLLMFLSILTSRYSENDFLNLLPIWMVVGIAMLFVSIVAMTVAFCTCLLFYEHGMVVISVLLVLFSSVPIMFVILKYPLFVTIMRCTYGRRWLFRSNNRLFS